MRVLSYAFMLGFMFLSGTGLAKPTSSIDLALEELSSRLEDPNCTIETMTESAELLQRVIDAAKRKSKDEMRALLETIKSTPVRSDGTPVSRDKYSAVDNLSREGKVGSAVVVVLKRHFFYNSHNIRATGAGVGAAAVIGGSGNELVGTAENQFGKAFLLTATVGVGAFPGVGVKLAIGRIVGNTNFDSDGKHAEDWGHSGDRLRGGSFVVGGMRLESPFSVAGNYVIYFVSVGTVGDYPFYVNVHFSKGHALARDRNYAGLKKRLGIS